MSQSGSSALLSVLEQRVSEAEARLNTLRASLRSYPKSEGSSDADVVRMRALRTVKELEAINQDQPEPLLLASESQDEPSELEQEGRFFLAVARLKERIEELKIDETVSKRNVQALQAQVQDMQALLADRDAFLTSLRAQVAASKASGARRVATDDQRERHESFERELRATTRLYKEFKDHLKEVLKMGGNEERAKLVQTMWNHYFATRDEEGQASFMKLSDLDFDVDAKDLEALKLVGILEANGESKDEYRMVDLTHG